MLYVCMYLFKYIMLTIVMVMSCDIISDTIFMLYFLCNTIVIIEINKFIYFRYTVSTISVNCIMLINNNIISNILICVLYIARFIYFIAIKHISWILADMLIYVSCLIECLLSDILYMYVYYVQQAICGL